METHAPISLVVGLGNPGPRYTHTRHNTGFWLLDEIAKQAGEQFRQEAKFFGEVCLVDKCWLLKPHTFMNHSGQSVAAFVNFYKIPLDEIVVVHDELDLPPGTVRLKQSGGDGGHKGIKDIILHLGSKDFLRLRIGIGRPAHGSEVVNYVLHKPALIEQEAIDASIAEALSVMKWLWMGRIDKAMQRLHCKAKKTTPNS